MRLPLVVLLLGGVLVAGPLAAQRGGHGGSPADTVALHRADSLVREAQRAYVEILEKTNQQLALRFNPYAVMVAALGVLFTGGAIVVGFVLFRQGREYRDLITKSITEYQGILNAFIEEKNREVEVLTTQVENRVATLSKELETATGTQKKQIERTIKDLERWKIALQPQVTPKPLPSYALGLGALGGWSAKSLAELSTRYSSTMPTHVCTRCGTSFPALGGLLAPEPKCPTCGLPITS